MSDKTPAMSDDYGLVLAFDTDSPTFVRGVEVGILHQRLRSEPLPVTAVVHAANAEMVMRLADAFEVTAVADDVGGDWLTVTYRFSCGSPGSGTS